MASNVRNPAWRSDIKLREDMEKYVSQGLRRDEILDFLIRDFPQYAWSLISPWPIVAIAHKALRFSRSKMAAAWKNFKTAMKEKRTGKKGGLSNDILAKQEVVIQRLSAEMSGKAQKYSRIGPREFVPYDYDEVTLANIKIACKKHFASRIGDEMLCDVLAGEQGPSCSSLDQIPDMRVVHIRFIDPVQSSEHEAAVHVQGIKRRQETQPKSEPSPRKKKSCISEMVPKSLSVVEMLKLGKVIHDKSTEIVHLYTFDVNQMSWSGNPEEVEFTIEKEPFGIGGFRKAFQATSKTTGFQNCKWVVKKYLPAAVENIEAIKQTLEQHTKKVVQMHMLAKNIAAKLQNELSKEDALELYGETLKYKKIYMGKMEGGEFVTIEEFIEGEFTKYINNNAELSSNDSEILKKVESLVHFSYEHSEKELMILDMQGSGYHLFDPEIASKKLMEDEEVLFSTGNLSTTAINNFINSHKCNMYCHLLGLQAL